MFKDHKYRTCVNTVPGITCEEIASHAELSAATGDYKTTSEKMKQRAFNFYFLFGQVYRSRRSFLYIFLFYWRQFFKNLCFVF